MALFEDEKEEAPKTVKGKGPKAESSSKKTCEDWKKQKGTSAWNYAGASGMHAWPLGMELSEKEYDEAVEAFATLLLK